MQLNLLSWLKIIAGGKWKWRCRCWIRLSWRRGSSSLKGPKATARSPSRYKTFTFISFQFYNLRVHFPALFFFCFHFVFCSCWVMWWKWWYCCRPSLTCINRCKMVMDVFISDSIAIYLSWILLLCFFSVKAVFIWQFHFFLTWFWWIWG